jgi:hypothetical protein
MKRYTILLLAGILLSSFLSKVHSQAMVKLLVVSEHTRIRFGSDRLAKALTEKRHRIINNNAPPKGNVYTIIVGLANQVPFHRLLGYNWKQPGITKEGFYIRTLGDDTLIIAGADPSGTLYGCLEIADRVMADGKLPASLEFTDNPEMVLRGACIGVQKPYYLPGRTVYEYPYTPETFPWFYDKQLWIQYLDSMVKNRMNSLYLWNGHPFASLVKVNEYPYAVEVDEATFKKNEEIFRFLTTEADKRGIWVIQMFYNIIVSKPFAEKHNIKTQDRERPIMPLIADYTRKSIAAFVQKYPNVGLMVCLGEAMEGTGTDDVEWFTKTIIPGVQDGLKAMRKTEEPPIVLRAHDTDAPTVMKAALPLYKNLYTEAKFNGEALTYDKPRGKWAELHQTLSRIGTMHIENVHIMANLEPFRYGAPGFIQDCVQGMRSIMEGKGLHLYPQASYWDWPYSADSVKGKRLLQIERDWIWYAAWSRYAWKSDRNRQSEADYWSRQLATKYGVDTKNGQHILEAYEQSGQIAPKLLRRFGITDGNRQTMTLGMLMTQLINPFRYGLFTLMYESESPVGEMLIEYAEKDWKGEKHIGETPPQIIAEVKAHADEAIKAIDAVTNVTVGKDEFKRLQNDMYCYHAMAYHYAYKAEAAIPILRYKYSGDIRDLEKGLSLLEKSVEYYKKLVDLTKGTYLYANSMQTQQRKIPIRGVNGTFKTWTEVLVPFETELSHFRHKIDSLKRNSNKVAALPVVLKNADVQWEGGQQFYITDSAARVFSDKDHLVHAVAPELKGLRGLVLSYEKQLREGTTISFTTKSPVKLLVGFFNAKDSFILKAPELETNASANNFGQSETKIANGIVVKGLPPVNIHTYTFPAGTHTLKLGKGICLILGFVNDNQPVPLYDAGLSEKGVKKEIDWLFE